MAHNDGPPGHSPHDSGWSAGESVRVQELESENRELAEKLASASQRVADYENEKRTLEARVRQLERRLQRQDALPEEGEDGAAAEQASPPPLTSKPGMARSFSFMSARKPVPTTATPSQRERELEAAFVKEQTLRIAAEKKVKDLDAEVEELSESLFQQANEMVAAERKKNADLEVKVTELESEVAALNAASSANPVALQKENVRLKERVSVLELRDVERQRRLEKIEAAAQRVERVKTLLLPR